jgi:hypothetical protein
MPKDGRGCHSNHVRGEDAPWAKLTSSAVVLIRASTDAADTLAGLLGVSRGTVNDVRMGRTWRHVGK